MRCILLQIEEGTRVIDLLYDTIHYSSSVGARDKRKIISCKEMGITLITVPYWWDGKLSSIATTIHAERPDIEIPSSYLASPIPKDFDQRKTPSGTF